jgi:hypothetical protein
VLDRRRSAPVKLTPLSRGRALRQLIIQNFAPGGTSVTAIDRVYHMIKSTPCFAFTYSNLDEAADFLSDRFSEAHAPWRGQLAGRFRGKRNNEITVEVASGKVRPRTARFTQAPGVTLRVVDNDIFLVKAGDAAIFHLNAMAASLWRMLEQPTTMATAINAVRQAFPAVDPRRVKRDVREVFGTLQDGALIRPYVVGAPSREKLPAPTR